MQSCALTLKACWTNSHHILSGSAMNSSQQVSSLGSNWMRQWQMGKFKSRSTQGTQKAVGESSYWTSRRDMQPGRLHGACGLPSWNLSFNITFSSVRCNPGKDTGWENSALRERLQGGKQWQGRIQLPLPNWGFFAPSIGLLLTTSCVTGLNT